MKTNVTMLYPVRNYLPMNYPMRISTKKHFSNCDKYKYVELGITRASNY